MSGYWTDIISRYSSTSKGSFYAVQALRDAVVAFLSFRAPAAARRARPGRDARFGVAGADQRDGFGRRRGNAARGGRTQTAGWGGIENAGRLADYGFCCPSLEPRTVVEPRTDRAGARGTTRR